MLTRVPLPRLRMALSEQNLELLPDYEQRIDVLKDLKFIDDNQTVLLKGRVACEVSCRRYDSPSLLTDALRPLADKLGQRARPHRAHPGERLRRLRA